MGANHTLNRSTLFAAAAGGAIACQAGAQAQTPASSGGDAVIHVPAHDLPMPASISPQGRAYLSQLAGNSSPYAGMTSGGGTGADAMRQRISATNRVLATMMAPQAAAANASVETQSMNGVTVYVAARNEASAAERRKAHVYI